MKILFIYILLTLIICGCNNNSSIESQFEVLDKLDWEIAFEDSCTKSWQQNWVMDGERSYIKHTTEGMEYYAGSEAHNDTCHTVLWTKQQFSGDIKIEYDYTRMDTSKLGVNIIYILASGSGKDRYDKDIFKWNDLRRVPAMKVYYNHMNTYHISYAAYSFNDEEPEYIRARRYMPETGKGLEGTELTPEYENSGFFKKGIKHHITIIRRENKLYMKVSNPTQTEYYWFDTSKFPSIVSGHIGLRHMWTRAARYANFQVYGL